MPLKFSLVSTILFSHGLFLMYLIHLLFYSTGFQLSLAAHCRRPGARVIPTRSPCSEIPIRSVGVGPGLPADADGQPGLERQPCICRFWQGCGMALVSPGELSAGPL